MAPLVNSLTGNSSEFPQEEAELCVVEITRDGYVIKFDIVETDDVNYSFELEQTIQIIPPFINYFACVNCYFPIAPFRDVETTFWALRHADIPIAYAFKVYENCIIIDYTRIDLFADIYWQTVVHCRNCNILLSVPALTIFNTMIDEYSNDERVVILDSGSVMMCRREPI